MFLHGYFDVFPEKSKTELRTATILEANPHESLPAGTYVFTEFFCTDPGCNCQRVLIKAFYAQSETARPSEVATISYSWNPDGDEVWAAVNEGMPNPHLDPLHHQAPCASELLEFWNIMIERDPAYASRLERHYAEIRAEMARRKGTSARLNVSNFRTSEGSTYSRDKAERMARRRRWARARKQK